MKRDAILAFECFTYCLSTNQGPFSEIESADFSCWEEILGALESLAWNVRLEQGQNAKSAAAEKAATAQETTGE